MTGFEDFLAGAVRLSAPIILAALGEVIVQRSGVINIGIEGTMLAGAFFGFLVAFQTGNPMLGVFASLGAGVAIGIIFALLTVIQKANQIVVGTGLNIAMLGLTGVLLRGIFEADANLGIQPIGVWNWPILSSFPVLGKAFFSQSALVYVSGAIAIGIWIFLRSRYGLGLRACGSNPEAADAAGVKVDAIRFGAVVFGAALAGLAGAYLSLVQTNTFSENMTSGRGFIALAVVIFGRWSPIGVVAASLIFGIANQAQFWMQARGSSLDFLGITAQVPYQFFLALPYLITLFVLAFFSGKYRGPAAIGKPYVRSS